MNFRPEEITCSAEAIPKHTVCFRFQFPVSPRSERPKHTVCFRFQFPASPRSERSERPKHTVCFRFQFHPGRKGLSTQCALDSSFQYHPGRKGLYCLCSVLQQSPQGYHSNTTTAGLVEHRSVLGHVIDCIDLHITT